ncbi:MAG: serine/threonine protein kinase [Chloroflexi bacterium]|nr:serine/threonine protein kinase [Chloroflexota bacterium]
MQNIEQYQCVRLVSQRGTKSLYEALDLRTSQKVALKVWQIQKNTPEYEPIKQRFMRIIKAFTTLDHPRVLPILAFGEAQETAKLSLLYAVTPWHSELTLDSWLQQESPSQPLPSPSVAYMIGQIADVLSYVHARNLMHLGLKPANILVNTATDTPHPLDLVLTGFESASFAHMQQVESIDPTALQYIAPEQWDGHTLPGIDQYALAVLAYELLAGKTLSPTETNQGEVLQQDMSHLEPLSHLHPYLTPAVDQVITRALSKEPDNRYPSIATFAQALQQALSSSGKKVGTKGVQNGHSQLLPSGPPVATLAPRFGSSTDIHRPSAPDKLDFFTAQQILGQLEEISSHMDTSKKSDMVVDMLVEKVDTLSIKVDKMLETQEEEVYETITDIPRYITKGIPRSLLVVGIALLVTILSCNSILMFGLGHSISQSANSLQHAIVANGNSNIQAIMDANTQMTATAAAQATSMQQVSVSARATATAIYINSLKNAATAQTIPPAYLQGITSNNAAGNLVFNDLINKSNSGQWSAQPIDDIHICSFGANDNFYHATMTQANIKPTLCQSSGDVGTVNTTNQFVLQVQVSILRGDGGGIAFDVRDDPNSINNATATAATSATATPTNKLYYYLSVTQAGKYEAGSNNVPFTNAKGQAPSFITGNGVDRFNLLAIVGNKDKLTFYVNLRPVFSISGINYDPMGALGLIARDDGSPTDVVFQNVKVWQFS